MPKMSKPFGGTQLWDHRYADSTQVLQGKTFWWVNKNLKKPAEFTIFWYFSTSEKTRYKIQDCHAPAEGPESVAFKVVGYGGYGDSSLAIMHSLWTHQEFLRDRSPSPSRSGTRRSSVLLQTASQAVVVREECLNLDIWRCCFCWLSRLSIQKDLMIHCLLMGFRDISSGLSWSPPVCWSDILDAKNWLPPETWMIDAGVNGFAQTLKTDIGRFMLFEDIQPFFSSPSRVLALQGYASEVETSECLGKTIDLIDMGALRFISGS